MPLWGIYRLLQKLDFTGYLITRSVCLRMLITHFKVIKFMKIIYLCKILKYKDYLCVVRFYQRISCMISRTTPQNITESNKCL